MKTIIQELKSRHVKHLEIGEANSFLIKTRERDWWEEERKKQEIKDDARKSK